jgi:hypothetical protein
LASKRFQEIAARLPQLKQAYAHRNWKKLADEELLNDGGYKAEHA